MTFKELKEMTPLRNSLSAFPILGLIEYFTRTGDANRRYASVLLMYLLKNENLINPRILARALTLVAMQTSKEKSYITSEGLFRKALSIVGDYVVYENADAHYQYAKMLENIEKRDRDVEVEIERANEVIQLLPYWAPKLMYIVVPDIELI